TGQVRPLPPQLQRRGANRRGRPRQGQRHEQERPRRRRCPRGQRRLAGAEHRGRPRLQRARLVRRPRRRRASRQGRGTRQHQARRHRGPPRATPGPGGVNTVLSTGVNTAVAAISARGLRKSYGEKIALDGIDLTVQQGTILALLGPNGAGKTTAVQLLTTYLRPDAGETRIAGQDPATNPQAVRRALGVTGQFSAVDGYLTGRENLRLMADLHLLPKDAGRRRAEELLERFELTEAADKTASTYSGGMKRKLDLAMTLLGSPKELFLEE